MTHMDLKRLNSHDMQRSFEDSGILLRYLRKRSCLTLNLETPLEWHDLSLISSYLWDSIFGHYLWASVVLPRYVHGCLGRVQRISCGRDLWDFWMPEILPLKSREISCMNQAALKPPERPRGPSNPKALIPTAELSLVVWTLPNSSCLNYENLPSSY